MPESGISNNASSHRRTRCWADGCLRVSFCNLCREHLEMIIGLFSANEEIREISLDFTTDSLLTVNSAHRRYTEYFELPFSDCEDEYVEYLNNSVYRCGSAEILVFMQKFTEYLQKRRGKLEFVALYGLTDDCLSNDFWRRLAGQRLLYFACTRYNGKEGDELLRAIAKMPNLRLLSLSGCNWLAEHVDLLLKVLEATIHGQKEFLKEKSSRLTRFDPKYGENPSVLQQIYCNLCFGGVEYLDISHISLQEDFYSRISKTVAAMKNLSCMDIEGSEIQLSERIIPSETDYNHVLALSMRFSAVTGQSPAFGRDIYDCLQNQFALNSENRQLLTELIGTARNSTISEEELAEFQQEIFSLDLLLSSVKNPIFAMLLEAKRITHLRSTFKDASFELLVRCVIRLNVAEIQSFIIKDRHFSKQMANAAGLETELAEPKSLRCILHFPHSRYFPVLGGSSALDDVEVPISLLGKHDMRVRMLLAGHANKMTPKESFKEPTPRLEKKKVETNFGEIKRCRYKREHKIQLYRKLSPARNEEDDKCNYHGKLLWTREETVEATEAVKQAEILNISKKFERNEDSLLSDAEIMENSTTDVENIQNAYASCLEAFGNSSIEQASYLPELLNESHAKSLSIMTTRAIGTLKLRDSHDWYLKNKGEVLHICEDIALELNSGKCSPEDAERFLAMQLGELPLR